MLHKLRHTLTPQSNHCTVPPIPNATHIQFSNQVISPGSLTLTFTFQNLTKSLNVTSVLSLESFANGRDMFGDKMHHSSSEFEGPFQRGKS